MQLHKKTISVHWRELFTVILEYSFKKLNNDETGINIDRKTLSNVRFADDIVLIADDLHKAEVMLKEIPFHKQPE